MTKKKLFRITTVSLSLDVLLKNQMRFLGCFFDVTIISNPDHILDRVGKRESVRAHGVAMEREISFLKDFVSLFKLWTLFLRERPWIVHSNTPKGSLLSMIAAYFSFVPNRIYTVTGLRFESESGFKRWLLIVMEKITCRMASVVVAESKGVKRLLEENRICSPGKAVIIGNGNLNGIDLAYWSRSDEIIGKSSLIEAMYNLESKFVFIFVGRLVKSKGIEELISAFAKLRSMHKNVKLLLLGNYEADPVSSETVSFIRNCTDIIEFGYVDDIRPYLSIANCLVLPSYREGFPNVVLQALAFDVPCVVTNVNGIEECITKYNGIVIPKSDVSALLQALKVMADGEFLINKKKNQSYLRDRFEQKEYFEKLLRFYQSL